MTLYDPPRRAVTGDAPLIVSHRARLFADMGADASAFLAASAKVEAWFRQAIASEYYIGWLIARTDDPLAVVAGAGMLVLSWPPGMHDTRAKRGQLLNVYTEPEHRRRGLARVLTAHALDEARRLDIRAVALHASKQGRPLYEQFGFEPTNEMRILL